MTRLTTYRCPTCGHTIQVRSERAAVTCPHPRRAIRAVAVMVVCESPTEHETPGKLVKTSDPRTAQTAGGLTPLLRSDAP